MVHNLRPDKHQPTIAAANNLYELSNTGALMNYLHKALFSPAKSALLQAVKKGHINTWPPFLDSLVTQYFFGSSTHRPYF
jgi:hypothetical protein